MDGDWYDISQYHRKHRWRHREQHRDTHRSQRVQWCRGSRPIILRYCPRRARSKQTAWTNRHTGLHVVNALCRLWTHHRPQVHRQHRCGLEVELLPWYHLRYHHHCLVPVLVPPANVLAAPRAGQDEVASLQGARLYWHLPFHCWMRLVSYWPFMGWPGISMDWASRTRNHHHRYPHARCFWSLW